MHYVYGAGDKQGQPAFDDAVLEVYYHRTATLDRTTNQTTYGDWMWDQSQGDSSTPGYHVVSGKWTSLPQTWANVAADVPSIKGYYADLGQNDPTNTNHIPSNTWVFPTYNNSLGGGISEGGKGATAYLDGYGYEVNPTHTIKYMPNKTTVTVNYVDDDNNKAVVGSQHWDGTTGQHIDLTLTPPDNYVLTPGWVNPSSYDFDGVNSSWYTVHVKHATQDVTDQQSKDQISKTETLTRKHLYGPGPHEGEKFGEPDILEVPWHRTATKDLVTNKVSFGDWHVIWDKVKQLSGATKMWGDSEHNWVNGGLIANHSGYSYLGVGAKAEAISADGKVSGHGFYWIGEQDIENNPTIVQYYGREKVNVPVNYVDFDTNEQLTTKWLTGDDYLDGNTITLNKDDLTDWGTSINKKYQLYAGQTLSTTYKIDTVTNNGNLTPITVYVVQPRTVQFTFADNDNTVNGQHPQVGDAVSVTGITGSTTSVNLTVPAGYKLVEGQQLPTTYTFAKGETKQVILLTHQHVTVQPDSPKTPSDKLPDNPDKSYPSGVAKDDLSKTVTRKVTIVASDGKSTVTNQTVTFTRNATVDEVTGNVTYGPWSENGKHEFATVDVPNVPGYTATGDAPSLIVTPDSKDTDVTIDYTANQQNTQIVFVDNDGKTVDTVDVNGKTGETVDTNAKVPDKWKLVDNETVPSTITFSADTPKTLTVHVEHKVVTKQLKINADLNLLRLIRFTYDINKHGDTYLQWINNDELNMLDNYYAGKPVRIGSVTGSVQYDLVSDEIIKVNDQTLKFSKTLLNYPSDNDVANGGSLTGGYDLVNHTFTDYLNEDTHNNLSYKVYASANLTKELFTNKELFGGSSSDSAAIPFTFENGKQYGSDYEINTSTIDNSFSINFGRLFKTAILGAVENDDGSLSATAILHMPIVYQPYISKTVTRTINITNPDKTVKTIKQTAEINQNVGIDYNSQLYIYLHKGNAYVTDNNWSTYEVPTIDGYTATQSQVDEIAVNGDTTDQTVNISYTANKQQVNINYVDISDGNKVVHTTTVSGVTDGDATVTNELPAGYKLVDGQSVPKTVHFNANNNDDINVKVQHATVTVTPNSPKTPSYKLPDNPSKSYPSGVAKDDLTKTVTRKVTITTPDNKSTVTNQTVTFTRNATVDEVTGNVTYGPWSENGKHEFATVNVPTVAGYTANGNVPNLTVTPDSKDTTVTINYTANEQSTQIVFVDKDGKTIDTVNVNGKTGETVQTNAKVPAGWKLVGNETIPSEVTFTGEGVPNKKVTVDHTTVTVTPDSPKTPSDQLPDNPNKNYPSGVSENDLNKTITRTIKVTTPNGQTKTAEQTIKLTRTATVDEVTGEVTYGKWSTGQWGAYDVPTLSGYTATQTEVVATSVDEHTTDQTVDISYTPNKQSTTIKYVDDKGEVVHTTTVNGVTDQTVKVSSEVPAGWTITKGQVPSEITFSADGHEPIEVTVAHQHVTVVPDNPQNNGTKLPDNPAKTFNGVESNDLNKTITRTIKVTTPDGQTKTVEQTVHLTRTADVDEVTGEVTYGKWTTGEWSNYDVPTVQGYTASQNEVSTAKVTGDTKDQTVTVTYTAEQQKLIVNFIDDTTGQTLKTINKDGLTNSNSNYNTKSDIQNYVNNHYRLVSDDTNGQNLVFDNDDSKTQTYNVHLAHNTHNINDSKIITETIHYKLDNGQKAFDDYNAQLSFTRTGYNDEVTGQNHWNDWQATNGQTFNAVQSPSKKGYTPDKTSIETVNVKPGDKNIDTTVTYNANAQVAKISYIDDNTGATLKTDNANGKFNQPISFDNNVDNQIKAFENQGYVLKSNSFNGQKYQADNNSNVFEVHLVHGTKNVQRTQKITETVNYQMDDGSQAPSTNTQSVNFTQNGVQDLVTNNIDWKATESQQFKAVDSLALTGYTPDIVSVPVTTVSFGDKDINKTVTYKANPQSAKITYIDDNTGKTLKVDDANGKFNQVIDFANMNSDIKDFENQGYVLKSNSFNGQKYQADNAKNTFEVHFTHGTKNVQRQDTITETVKYQYDNGTPAHENNVQTLNFTQDGVQDLVTKNIDWKPTDAQEFKQVGTPAIDGYTPDITSISATKVNFGDSDINKVVTYQANNQTANIHYVDDMTGSSIDNGTANGKFGTVIDFGNVNDKINTFKSLGYQLVSNDFSGQTYQSDNSKNVYYVHFTHGIKNIQRNKQITETIKYQYENGQQAQPDSVQTVSFNENGSQDLVTKKINWFNDVPQQFKAVSTPTITGYTADIDNIPAVVVNYDNDNINKVVTYKANSQTAKINYIDDTTGKVIKTDTANGKFNQTISFSETPTNVINDLIKRGYKLVSNSFNGQTYQNDNSKNEFTVHLAHNTKNVSKQNTVTRTINYLDNNGKAIQTPTVETVTFTQNGITDLVTGNTTWNTPSSQTFETVTSPTIKGFGKPDVEVVKSQTVNFNDQNVVVNVHYTKVTTPTNVNNNTTTPTVDHDKGKLNPTTFTTTAHQTTPQAHTANNGGQQSITPQSVNKPSEQPTVANNGTKADTLPQTGNSDDNSTAIVGLGLLSGMLGLLGLKGKKKQN